MTEKDRLKLFLILAAFVIAALFLNSQFRAYTERYAIEEAEKQVQDTLFTHRAIHRYVAGVSRPEIYRLKDKGYLYQEYFSPKTMSFTYTARAIMGLRNQERKEYGLPEIHFKLASGNPRNKVNLADEYELALLERMNREGLNEHHQVISDSDGKKSLRYVMATLPTTQDCLRCHGDPENAPAEMVAQYPGASGYYEEAGIVRAIISINIPLDQHLAAGRAIADRLTLITLVAFSVVYGLICFFMRQGSKQHQVIVQKNRQLEGLTRIQREFMASADNRSTFEQLLALLLAASESEYGFIGEVHRRADGVSYLKVCAISNIAWDADTEVLYQAKAAEGMEFCNLKTLYGATITSAQPVISNDPARDPRSGGLPAGHPALRNYFGIPLLHGDQLVGMVGVANRSGGYYEELVQQLSPITTTAVGMIVAMDLERGRAQAEEALQQKSDELFRSNAELEQFAYVVSHDLRQPLRMINSYMNLLERALGDKLDDETREMMGFAAGGARRMDQMLVSLLEYSRVGRKGEPMAPLASREAVAEALDFLAPEIEETGAKVRVFGEWPEIVASRDEFTRLWQNLIGNALKYRAPDRVPQVEVMVAPEDGGWRFCVADNGIGIDPQQFDRLFKVFQRLHTRDQYEGTGIGLAVARKIVERHGGRIWVESEGAGQGCRFIFILPNAEEAANASSQ